MSISSRVASFLIFALLVITFTWTAPTLGAELSDTVVLVATPQFQDALYGETILIARSLEDGQHVGFILNKPTQYLLADAFPEHAPSKKVRDPIYLGGPDEGDAVFALVASHDSPGSGWMQLAPDLFVAVAADTVDRIIESGADHARFFAGAVVWQPGELDEELKRGVWYVLEPEPELVLPKQTEGLWQQLVHRAEIRDKAI
jgi:putative transcriptional regulator